MFKQWEGFNTGKWSDGCIDVRDFIQKNYTPYTGTAVFARTYGKKPCFVEGNLSPFGIGKAKRRRTDADTHIISKVTSHKPGYIDRNLEKIVGLQTDVPFKRGLQPFGGIRVAEQALKEYGYEIDPDVRTIFKKYCKTHNRGGLRRLHAGNATLPHRSHSTGLPDSYGRGRIIGDYRRLPLYGADF